LAKETQGQTAFFSFALEGDVLITYIISIEKIKDSIIYGSVHWINKIIVYPGNMIFAM
jgi:hypothetical protein